jgi:flagellar biosynthesis anti-sigma factor FlgM
MAKINLDKLQSYEPIRPEKQSDVKGGKSTPVRPPQPVEGGTEKDRVDLSGTAAEVGRLVTQIKDLPDVRADKVAETRAEIASGSFNPSSDQIANAIFKHEQN